jgi:RimJ/RimL family protein N-acetyltransferase
MPALEGQGVRLRPIAAADLEGIFSWYNDPEIVAPFDRFAVDTYDDFERSVAAAAHDPRSLAPRYAVESLAPAEVIGVVGHYRAHPVLEYVDVWYVLGRREARGKGWGREAVRLLVEQLFATEPVERVGATCDVENVPSIRLLEGLRFRREGTLRSVLFHHGAWHDVHVYGLTRAEQRAGAARPPSG